MLLLFVGVCHFALRADESVRDASIEKARAGGITTANLMSGSGHLLSGQTIYLKLRDGNTIEDLMIYTKDDEIAGGIKMANGTNSRRDPPFPGTRAKSAALVRQRYIEAQGAAENITMEMPAILKREGIPFALQSSFESYVPKTRVVLFEAAIAAAYGLPFDAALASITIDAAKILGIDQRVGSIEAGKDADLALFDGDPFEYTSHCTTVVIAGKIVSDSPR